MNKKKYLKAWILISLALSCSMSVQAHSEKNNLAIGRHHMMALAPSQSDDLNAAEALSAKVVKLYADGNYNEALELALRVLEIRDNELGPEHHLIDEALFNLGEIYSAKYMYKEAEPFYQRLLAHYEKVYGLEHLKTAKILERLAIVSAQTRNFDEAEKRILRVLAIYEKPPGVSPTQLASLTLQVAELYRVKGDKRKAETTYLRAIELSDPIKEPSDSKTVSLSQKAVDRYVCFLYETKPLGSAQEIERRFYEDRKKAWEANKDSKDDLLNGKARSLPKPTYPPYAKSKGVFGTVRVRVKLDEQGKVIEANAVCGPPSLRSAAVMAALDARFSPTLFKGKPITVIGIINYNFRLR